MVAFTGIDPLIVQMRADVDQIRTLLADSTMHSGQSGPPRA